MNVPRLYLDEDVSPSVAAGLRGRGFDVLTAVETSRTGLADEDQLQFAISETRSLFTFNRGDFVQLHARLMNEGRHHFGIIVSRQVRIGLAVRSLSFLISTYRADELRDRLIWLSAK